jgi:hypothetical protein
MAVARRDTPDLDLPPRHRSLGLVLESALGGLPQLRLLHERALLTVDAAHGTFRVHRLLVRHVRGKHDQSLAQSQAAA